MTRWHHVGLTLRKELRETIRDRRTLLVMVLFPLVVYPLLALLATQISLLRESRLEEKPARIGADLDRPSEMARAIRKLVAADPKRFAIVDGATPKQIESAAIDVYAVAAGAPHESPAPALEVVELRYDATLDASRRAEERLADALETLLPPGCVRTFSITHTDAATRSKKGGYLLSKALPLLIVLMLMLGAFYPSIDTTAGERERGTIETTLVAPIRRFDLLLGKVIAVAILATATGVLNLASMSLTVVHAVSMARPEMALPIPWARVAVTALALVPAAMLFASLMVTVATTAKSFKEAQNLLTPLYFLFFIPAVVASMGDYALSPGLAFVPGLNVTLLARDLTLGSATPMSVLLVTVSTVVYTAASLTVAARLYDPERLLAITDERRAGATRVRSPLAAADAAVVFAIAFVLFIASAPLQVKNLLGGLLVSEWIGMLGFVLLYARLRRLSLRDHLGFRWPRAGALVGALVMGSGAWLCAALLTEWMVPPPPEVLKELNETLLGGGARPLPVMLLVMALTPGICEEALFRGPILRGLRASFPPAMAMILSGLAFAIFHVSLYRLLPTFLLGLMLAWIALASGSIVPGMLAHVANNAILLSLSSAEGGEKPVGDVALPAQLGGFAVGAAVVLIGARLILRARAADRPEAARPGADRAEGGL